MWNECNCVVVWTFFAFLWDWNENWFFSVHSHCWVFQICWQIQCSTLIATSFRIWNISAGSSSPALLLLLLLSCFSRVQLFVTPWTRQPARLLCPCNSPDKNTGVGSHSLLQGIFPTQGSNPDLLHCRRILYVWATTLNWVICRITYLKRKCPSSQTFFLSTTVSEFDLWFLCLFLIQLEHLEVLGSHTVEV